jgi:hypothetical protein
MRKVPGLLFYFWVAIQIARVAGFLAIGMQLAWIGWVTSIGLALCLGASSYFLRFHQTRVWAWIGVIVFGFSDLWFNEFELIRTLSQAQILPPHSNFLNWNYESLVVGMQGTALMVGALPTFANIILGGMASGAGKIQVQGKKGNKPTYTVGIMAKITNALPAIFGNEKLLPEPEYQDGRIVERVGKNKLGADQIARIANMPEGQIIANFGVSGRTARKWKKDIRDGVMK